MLFATRKGIAPRTFSLSASLAGSKADAAVTPLPEFGEVLTLCYLILYYVVQFPDVRIL